MLTITNLTKKKIPKIPWRRIKEKILGKKYNLSFVFTNDGLMKKLNARYRKPACRSGRKNKPASVLSFSLSKSEGEIFVNASQKKHHPLPLFIHGLLHLKNFQHGVKMEIQEKKLIRKFTGYGAGYYHRP